ncbi:MAG: glycosyltransferase [Candidatus Krumholzibacteriota bacterium]|nr:glycosyltransferase [Candidatus Krumholzibacteriota bacterium]
MSVRPEKILILTSSLGGGGAERHILNLCRYLNACSVEVELMTISPEKNQLENEFREEKIPVRYFPLSSLKKLLLPGKMRALKKTVREISPDLIHAHLFHAEVTGVFASYLAGIPLIVTRHSSGIEFEGFRRVISRIISGRISHVVAVSAEAAREALACGNAGSRVSTLPSGIDTDIFVPLAEEEKVKAKSEWLERLFTDKASGNEIVVGTLARMRKEKNHPLFLRIVSRIIEERGSDDRAVRFVIIGDGPERQKLESLRSDLGLGGIVSMPGFNSDAPEILPLFDIFILTSDHEGVPLALLEAMSCGAACVASNVGGVASVLRGSGIIVEPGDTDGFVREVSTLIDYPEKRSLLSRKSRGKIVLDYDIAAWGRSMLEIYGKVSRIVPATGSARIKIIRKNGKN